MPSLSEHERPTAALSGYALLPGSGADGKFRGGMGVVRDYRILADDGVISLSSERQHNPARGMAGGEAGECGAFIKDPGTPNELKLPSASGEIPMPKGSILSIRTPGGGGYGESDARDAVALERDRRDERV